MKCPYCGCEESMVVGARESQRGRRRYRKCEYCNQRFKTVEKYDWMWPEKMTFEALQKKLGVKLGA